MLDSGLAPSANANAVNRVPRRPLLGLTFDAMRLEQAVGRLLELARQGAASLVLTPNVDHVVRAARDAEFRALYRQGTLVVADGQPVVWASRLLGQPLPERVAGSDLMPRSAVAAAQQGLQFFLLGGSPGDAERCAHVLAQRAGRNGCCGVDCPPLGFERDPHYLDALVAKINAAAPDILYVGLGSPKQERVMAWLRPRVKAGVLMAVGVTFSFVAGTVRRAPLAFQRLGIEWLWRLACEPRRLARRYANNLLSFPVLVASELWQARRLRQARTLRSSSADSPPLA